jgi:hypothetical protein
MAAHRAFVNACQQFGYDDQFGYYGDIDNAPVTLVAVQKASHAIMHHWYGVRDGIDAYTGGAMQ